MDDTLRRKTNDERLGLIDTSIRPQVAQVIADLETGGFHPLIAKDVWRDPARQMELFKQGRSQVTWGFHCATVPGSKPAKPGSLAADIVDADLAWEAPRAFWTALGASAIRRGLGWGGFFGLTTAQKEAVRRYVQNPVAGIKLSFGWDVAHVETARVNYAQARAGKR